MVLRSFPEDSCSQGAALAALKQRVARCTRVAREHHAASPEKRSDDERERQVFTDRGSRSPCVNHVQRDAPGPRRSSHRHSSSYASLRDLLGEDCELRRRGEWDQFEAQNARSPTGGKTRVRGPIGLKRCTHRNEYEVESSVPATCPPNRERCRGTYPPSKRACMFARIGSSGGLMPPRSRVGAVKTSRRRIPGPQRPTPRQAQSFASCLPTRDECQ